VKLQDFIEQIKFSIEEEKCLYAVLVDEIISDEFKKLIEEDEIIKFRIMIDYGQHVLDKGIYSFFSIKILLKFSLNYSCL
jgi:hypothetical protein